MKIDTRQIDDTSVCLRLDGDLDAASCEVVRPAFSDLAEGAEKTTVRLDLANVGFLDSSGVGAIVFLWKRLKQKGSELILVDPTGQPASLLEVLRIGKSIKIEEYA